MRFQFLRVIALVDRVGVGRQEGGSVLCESARISRIGMIVPDSVSIIV